MSMKEKKKKYKYIGIRNYPKKINGKIIRPGDVVELSNKEISELDIWHFEALTTQTEPTFEEATTTEMDEKKKSKEVE